MTVTMLDPKSALIVIDLQKGIAALPAVHPMAEVIERASALAKSFRRHGLPVVLVNVDGTPAGRTDQPSRSGGVFPAGWTDLVDALNRQPGDHLVTKRTSGAFTNTGLEAHLRTSGVTQVVLAGVATSNGVEATARDAYALGFNVTLATDAMTDLNPDAHTNSVTRIFPKLGETGTTREIIDCLDKTRTLP